MIMKAMKSNYANRSLNKKIKGSITVEAAFIMPLIILVIFSIVYLSFYLHDYCKLQGTVDLALHKAIFSAKHKRVDTERSIMRILIIEASFIPS